MLLKYFSSLALLCVLTTSLFAQDAFDTLQRPLNRKVGIYKTYKDFLKNNPIISKPIKVIRINPDQKSINPKYNCVFDDSSTIDERVWGLFDGNKFIIGRVAAILYRCTLQVSFRFIFTETIRI